VELDAFRKEYRFPGATAAYILPDGEVGVAAIGIADLRTNTEMTPQSRMLAASIGKTFVGATVVALARDRRLGLDDPISDWLGHRDWFSRLPNHDAITVRHLLTHSAGLPDHVHDAGFRAAAMDRWHGTENPFPPEALVAFVLDQPPLFEAGQSWAYADTGFILLGVVIESATGQDYYDAIRERFIDPLKLIQTTPSNRPNLKDLATGYMSQDNPFGFPPETTTSQGVMVWNPGVEWTGGGLVSTSRDLALWGATLFQGRAMDAPYLGDLLAAVSIDPRNPEVEYGLGVAIHRSGSYGAVYGHGGWIPGYSSSLRYYADHEVSIAFPINTDIGIVDDSTPLVRELEQRLAQLVVGDLDASIESEKPKIGCHLGPIQGRPNPKLCSE
jgi:D-alanyl-D-alanine carboxypeptidase